MIPVTTEHLQSFVDELDFEGNNRYLYHLHGPKGLLYSPNAKLFIITVHGIEEYITKDINDAVETYNNI